MSRPDDGGFALVDALVATAIAAVALTALVRVYAGASSAADRAVELLTATEVAEEQLARLLAHPEPRTAPLGPASERGLVWQAEAVPEADDRTRGAGALWRLTVTVTSPRAAAPLVKVSTLRAGSAD